MDLVISGYVYVLVYGGKTVKQTWSISPPYNVKGKMSKSGLNKNGYTADLFEFFHNFRLFGLLNIGDVSNETNTDVCMYTC